MQKVSDKDKTSTYCFMVFAFVMVLVGVYILSCISFYPAFEKECRNQEELYRRINHLEHEVYYPETIVEQWTDTSYYTVLTGRSCFSRAKGYKVSGLIDFNDREYHITIKSEVMSENNHSPFSSNYQNILYELVKAGREKQGMFVHDNVMYIVFVSPSDLYTSTDESEEIVVHSVEAMIDGLLSN
jgi:hypothetical protein